MQPLIIMCDAEGELGNADEAERRQAVQNHHKSVNAAKFLGCHSIRVNAQSSGTYEEQQQRAADGLSQLAEYGSQQGVDIIVENHGGLSSNGEWLAGVMKMANNPAFRNAARLRQLLPGTRSAHRRNSPAVGLPG